MTAIPLKFKDPVGPLKPEKPAPKWIEGTVATPAGPVYKASTVLSYRDYREHFRCRVSGYRDNFTIEPGVYAVGSPDGNSEVFVSANYKYSFDLLRQALHGLDGWILALDTKGINVWCAAGKGAFGTVELIKKISDCRLASIVEHRRLVLPQLGAPGISAHQVSKNTGFKVHYGPVYAKDLPAYLAAGRKASPDMRTVKFTIKDRLILTPMEIIPAMKNYPLFALIVLFAFGLQPSGIMFGDAFYGGAPFLILGLSAVLSGAFVTPLLLPAIPFRSFALKGWATGLLTVFAYHKLVAPSLVSPLPLTLISYIFFPSASSYIALQFTGSTTFTGMSGVKKELKYGIPLYITSIAVSLIIMSVYKLVEWGLL
ncbi:MAG: acetyl-CoA synthase subunit gamma [Nitrospirae bacterium]|nr:MAG: acetyl-CoA synthase subunit gamma [Nitrospirota bacterium]